MLTILFFVLGTIGAFVVLVLIGLGTLVVALSPISFISGRKLEWKVDLRKYLPPVKMQVGNSCACHAAAAALAVNGINVVDPDEWYNRQLLPYAGGLTSHDVTMMLSVAVSPSTDVTYDILNPQDIVTTISNGVPVIVGIAGVMHIVDSMKVSLPFTRQNLGRGYRVARYLSKYVKKPVLMGHAMLVAGISVDNKTVLLRDSAGTSVGDGGYWVMPVELLKDMLVEDCVWGVGKYEDLFRL